MNERAVQFRVGVVVLSTVIIAIILILMFSEGDLFPWAANKYQIKATFRRAPGVSVDSPVRRNGVRVGEVSNIEFLKDGRVQLTLEIDRQYRLRVSEECQIRSGLLGDSVVEFVPAADQEPSSKLLEDGDQIVGHAIPNPVEMLADLQGDLAGAAKSIAGAGRSFSAAGDSVNQLAARVDNIVAENQAEISRLVDNASTAMEGISSASRKIDDLLSDEQSMEALRRGLNDFPLVLENARNALASLERNLANLEGLTEPLGERGEELILQLEAAIRQLDGVLGQANTFSQALNNPDGTIGKLLNDPDLYQSINATAQNIQALTVRLAPILNDVRVFTDKIARDPSRIINLRSALQNRSPIK